MTKVKGSHTLDVLKDGGDGLGKSRRRVLGYNYLSNVVASLMSGAYFTGLMLEMKASDSYISTVTLIITICGFAQFFSPLVIERMRQRKTFLILMRVFYHIFNTVMIGIVPLLPISTYARLFIFMIFVATSNLISALTASGISVWHIQSIPEEKRSDFFTVSHIGFQLLNTLTSFSAGRLVDTFSHSSVTLFSIGSPLIAFLIIRVIALVMGGAEIILLSGIKEHPYERADTSRIALKELFIPIKDRAFMRIILIYVLYFFSAGIIGRYFQTYLIDVVHMSYTYQSISGVIGLPIVLLLAPVWSALMRKISWSKVLPIALFGTSVGYFFNTLITESTQYFHILCCVFYSSFNSAVSIIFAFLPYTAMPQHNRTAYISFFTISGSIAGLFGNLFGMLFMSVVKGAKTHIFGLTITSYQLLNLTQTICFVLLAIYTAFAVKRSDKKVSV